MKKNKPRDLDQNNNPFQNGMRVRVKILHNTEVFHNLSDTEIDDNTVVGLSHDNMSRTKKIVVELEKSVNLQLTYDGEDRSHVYQNLSGGAKEMLIEISTNIGKNKTIYYLDRVGYMSKYGIKSQTTFISHRNELIDAGFISLSPKTNWLWVNPMYIFNGIRSQFFKEYCKVEDVIKLKG
jgi:hypothetical protein